MARFPYSVDENGVRLFVRITPRGRSDEIGGLVDIGGGRTALAVRLAAPPVEGAANRALIALFAGRLGLPKSAISIESGEKSRLKVVRVAGADVEVLAPLLSEREGRKARAAKAVSGG